MYNLCKTCRQVDILMFNMVDFSIWRTIQQKVVIFSLHITCISTHLNLKYMVKNQKKKLKRKQINHGRGKHYGPRYLQLREINVKQNKNTSGNLQK